MTIKNASQELANNRLTIIEFIETVAAVIGRKINLPVEGNSSESEEEEIDRPPSPLPQVQEQGFAANFPGISLFYFTTYLYE